VQCGGEVTRNILAKWRKNLAENIYGPWLYPDLSLTKVDKFQVTIVENNLVCILLCATVLNRFLCFQPVSLFTDHISTKYNMIHKEVHYCHSNAPLTPRDTIM
jgi:hypothetical protein